MCKLINKIAHYSNSSVGSFQNCARGWWLKYVMDMSLPAGSAASFGNQYDELVAHKLGLEPMDVRTRDAEKPKIFQQVLQEGVEDAVNGYLIQPNAPTKENSVCTQKKITILPDEWAVLAEDLGLCLEIDKPIIGYIDMIIMNGVQRTIIDQKTSKRKGMRASWAMQLLLYCIAENCNAARIDLMTTTKTPAYYTYPIMVNDISKKWVMTNFTYYANEIEKALRSGCGENLPANPDYWCGWCADKLECPAKSGYIS